MDRITKYIGYIAFGSMAYFLYRSMKSGKDHKSPIEGLNLEVNPEKIIDSVLPWAPIPNNYRGPVGNSLKKFINGYVAEKR